MGGKYVLVGHEQVLESDLHKWARWFETAERIVKKTEVGKLTVSTVFLGLDYQFGDGPPLLFETMVFGGPDEVQERYSTWAEAEEGHDKIVGSLS